MENEFSKNLRETVLDIISSKKDEQYINFYKLLQEISNIYNLEIYGNVDDKVLHVKGSNGYQILASIYFLLNEMEQRHIILWIRNENNGSKEYKIVSDPLPDPNSDTGKITGSLLAFLRDNIKANIWFSPEIDWYMKHNYQTEELVEAKYQTKLAQLTLLVAIITMLVSVILPLFINR